MSTDGIKASIETSVTTTVKVKSQTRTANKRKKQSITNNDFVGGNENSPPIEPAKSQTLKKSRAVTYVPHVDGKGPVLTGQWEEQIEKSHRLAEELFPDHILIGVWNVNGFRAICKSQKNHLTNVQIQEENHPGAFRAYLLKEKPDVLALNETKLPANSPLEDEFEGYRVYHTHSQKPGYAGVAMMVRLELVGCVRECLRGIGDEEHDLEGRSLTLVFNKIIIVASYVVNAGSNLQRLNYRVTQFDTAMRRHLETVKEKYKLPVIWLGDLNCAREEIDIWNSKANAKSAGHTKEERDSMTRLLTEPVGDDGPSQYRWIDLWRERHPNVRRYTFWPARSVQSRVENLGWRLDYVIISSDLNEVCGICDIRDEVQGSDHCPVVVSLPKRFFYEQFEPTEGGLRER